jgi:uncharacterized protein YdaU (DUF1376 family)
MPAAERAPAFQCYAEDHLTDSAELSDEEFGQYWKLALYAWREMGLPGDHARIAKILRMTKRQFDASWAAIGGRFVLRDGRYVLPWQEDERQKQAENRIKRVAAANKRWGKNLEDADADQEHSGDDAHGQPEPSKTDARALQTESPSNSHLPPSRQSTTTTSVIDPEEMARRVALLKGYAKVREVAQVLPTDDTREFLYLFLVRASVTGSVRVEHWLAKFRDWLNPDGMEGVKATPQILGTALGDYAINGFMDDGFEITARHFLAFVIHVRDKLPLPVRVGSKNWKPGKNVKSAAPIDTAGNDAAADRLKRQLGNDT